MANADDREIIVTAKEKAAQKAVGAWCYLTCTNCNKIMTHKTAVFPRMEEDKNGPFAYRYHTTKYYRCPFCGGINFEEML